MHRSTIALLPLALLLIAGQATADKIEMSEPVEYPHAGIALAVPTGFVSVGLTEPADIMRAVISKDGVAVQSVHLSAYPVDAKVTAEKFAAERIERLRANLAVRRLEVLKKTAMPVAGLTATAQRLRYTFRGQPTEAAGVCFVRDLPGSSGRICYLLVTECTGQALDALLPVLGEVVTSISLTAMRRPMDAPVGPLGEPVTDFKRGYALRAPQRWFTTWTATGVVAAQTDYLRVGAELDGLPMPQLRILVMDVPAGTTGCDCARNCIEMAIQAAEGITPPVEAELLSEGPAELAGRDAYRFVLVHKPAPVAATGPAESMPAATQPTATAPAGPAAEDVIVAQQTMCVPGADGRGRSYSLVLLCSGTSEQKAENLLDELAAGFELLAPPASQPATMPATSPACQPCYDAPETAPAVTK